MHYGASPAIFKIARQLRKNPTKAEAFLWEYLRKNQMGRRFRRQHPTWLYVVDFYCHPLRLIIEIDGGIHEEAEQQINDKEKTENLESLGLHIIRFSNEQVLFDIDNTLSLIAAKMTELRYLRFKEKTSY
ncbi:MAG: endonuclease domain-containing protein [Saprospiraceae bacterium]|nr:endonuclease domain-containing protein [Candidatus Opimibacter skivensis]